MVGAGEVSKANPKVRMRRDLLCQRQAGDLLEVLGGGIEVWRVMAERPNGCIQAAIRFQLSDEISEVGELSVIQKAEQVEEILLGSLERRRSQKHKPVG